MSRLRHLESLLEQALAINAPREMRQTYRAEIAKVARQIRESLPPIDAPAPPPRETRATNPNKVRDIREARPRRIDPIKGREQTQREGEAVRAILEAVPWHRLTEAEASLIARGYSKSRPALRKVIERELLLLASTMTEAENQSARVVLGLLSVVRKAS
jgi:hypothetical protein